MALKVLVSGFEPFGGSHANPSQLLVKELVQEKIEGASLEAIVLPVEFDRAAELLLNKVREIKPDVVVAFGQAEGRKAITPEKIAINLDNARIPDNSGDQRQNQMIDKDGADGYFTTLPTSEIIAGITNEGIPAELSLSAGAFVCNHVFYQLQKSLKGTNVRSGFVHIPLVTEQGPEFPGQPTMELSDLVRGARKLVEVLVRSV